LKFLVKNNFNKLFIFLNILLIGLSFPIQVLLNTSFVYVLPILLTIALFIKLNKKLTKIKFDRTDIFILILSILIMINSFTQFITSNFDINILVNLFTFSVSVQLYIYFKFYKNDNALRYFILAILIIGIISAAFFIYDSYYKFFLFEPTNFSKLATEYQNYRSNDEGVTSRSLIDYRSAGLLDKAPISAAYVSFALFVTLSGFKFKYKLITYILTFFLSFALLLSLNFTAIICTIISICLINFRMLTLIYNRINLRLIKLPIILLFCLSTVIFLFLLYTETDFLKSLLNTYNTFIFSSTTNEPTLSSRLYEEAIKIFTNQSNIISFILGDGYPGNYYNDYPKGGDFGFIDNMIGMGIFLYIYFIFLIFKNCIYNFKKYKLTTNYNFINLTILILVYVVLMDIHYSILFFKSINPIFFIALGILSKESKIQLSN
jgi:hypothetical protein